MRGLLFGVLAVGLGAPAGAQTINMSLNPGEVLLRVEAEGVSLTRPDIMSISAGVETTGRTAGEALEENARIANKLIDAIRASGIEPRDVRTTDLEVQPQYAKSSNGRDDDDEGPRPIIGYVASNKLEVTLRDLAKAGSIIDSLFKAGANSVRGPTFGLRDTGPAVKSARRAAAAEATKEAQEYADAFKMRIVRTLKISETQVDEPYDGANSGGIVVTGSRIRPTPIEPGEVSTTVRLAVDYAVVPQ